MKIKKIIWWISGVIGASFISVLVNSALSQINLWESFLKIIKFLFKPEIGLLILILILYGLLFSIDKKFREIKQGLSDKNIKEILSNNKRLIKINDELREKANKIIKIYEEAKIENERLAPKKEEKKLELTEEQLFILALIAESDEESVNFLFESFRKQFPEANLVDVKYIANLLEKNGLIRCVGNIGGSLSYVATDKGIERVMKESDIIKKYRKAIEEHKEMSKKASQF